VSRSNVTLSIRISSLSYQRQCEPGCHDDPNVLTPHHYPEHLCDVARISPIDGSKENNPPDLIVAGMALTISSLPYMGAEAGLLWTLVGGMFGVLIAITGVTRQGYVEAEFGEWQLKRSTAVWTSAAGGAAPTAAW